MANTMKRKLMMKLLLLVGLLSGFAPVAQAFYNPSTGRWLSRDPIEEQGGFKIYGFGKNNAINGIDSLGLRWTDADEWRFHRPEGCCFYKGKILSDKKVATGVSTERWTATVPDHTGRFPYHVWVQWDGGSADINGLNGLYFYQSRAGFTPSDPDRKSEPLMLSECKYDFEKLKDCLVNESAKVQGKQRMGYECGEYATDLVNKCVAASKRHNP
jgi:hypothetical protein